MTNDKDEATQESKERVASNAAKLLLFLVTDGPNMVRLADMRRAKLKARINRGEKPKDHRIDFINQASSEIFGWLGDKALEFSEKYPFDVFTVGDLHDVLVNAANKLRAKINQEAQEAREPPKPTSAS